MTRGGPDNSTTSIVMVIVREAFTRFDLGAAAAVSVVVLVALVALNATVPSRRRSPSTRRGRCASCRWPSWAPTSSGSRHRVAT